MNKTTKRILIVIALIITIGMYKTCGAQTIFSPDSIRHVVWDTMLARVHRLIKPAGADSEKIQLIESFIRDSGMLAAPVPLFNDGDGFRPLERSRPYIFFFCPILDADISVIETHWSKKYTVPAFTVNDRAAVLYVPVQILTRKDWLVLYLNESYHAYILLVLRQYEGSYVDKIANEAVLAEFNGAVLKGMFSRKYTLAMNTCATQVFARLRLQKKSTLADMYPLIDSLGKSTAEEFFGTESSALEAKERNRLFSIQIERAITKRKFPLEDVGRRERQENEEKKKETDEAYLKYVFPEKT